MASKLSLLAQLAASIADNAEKVEAYLTAHDLPLPGFDLDAPVEYTSLLKDPEIRRAQLALASDAKALHLLMAGHAELLRTQGMREATKLGALRLLCHFNVPENVPFEGSVSLTVLSEVTGLELDILTRSIRLVAVEYIFSEAEPGYISHTARSKILATEAAQKATTEFVVTETLPTVGKYVDSVLAAPARNVSPFELAIGLPFFQHKKQNPEKNALFATVMSGNKKQNRGQELVNSYDWNRFSGILVDIGSGIGHIAVVLARSAPGLTFVLQDLPELQGQADAYIASQDLSSRITYQGHDFFSPQPSSTHNACVYLLSNVLHDWPDAKCLDILRPILAAMGDESRLIICESILPEPGQLTRDQEFTLRAQDMGMFGFFRARERSLADLTRLVQSIDPSVNVVRFVGPPTTPRDSIIEFARKL